MVIGKWALLLALPLAVGCPSGSRELAAANVAVPATAPAPAVLFERRRDLDRGFEQVRETARLDGVSVIRVETNYFGGAIGGAMFGMSCLSDLCRERGCSHYVILSLHAVRYGTSWSPGNDWEATVGFLDGPDQSVVAAFPNLCETGREYRVWPATGVPDSSLADFMEGAWPSELWDLFTSIHYHYRSPETSGEAPVDPLDPKFTAESADKAEQELAATPTGGPMYAWRLGKAAKAAASAGRWESSETWGNELLAIAARGKSRDGNAVHDAHVVLGRVALHRGDIDAAKVHLLKAGMTPGSPVLGSFGPNMSLARDLLEAGETETVLQYFDECRGFWVHHRDTLDEWTTIVERGGMPEFRANLVY